jgi:kinetochore protein Spc7/SPC105
LGAIATAKGLCDRYTRSDVLRLRDEVGALQALHLWRVEGVDEEESVRLVYDGEVRVVVPLRGKEGRCDVRGARVEWDVEEPQQGRRSVWGTDKGKGRGPTEGLRRVWEEAVREVGRREGATLASVSQDWGCDVGRGEGRRARTRGSR